MATTNENKGFYKLSWLPFTSFPGSSASDSVLVTWRKT